MVKLSAPPKDWRREGPLLMLFPSDEPLRLMGLGDRNVSSSTLSRNRYFSYNKIITNEIYQPRKKYTQHLRNDYKQKVTFNCASDLAARSVITSLSRNCCISPCQQNSTKVKIRNWQGNLIILKYKIINFYGTESCRTIVPLYLQEPSFLKPLFYWHHFIIGIFPFISYDRRHSICCNFCTS